MKDCLTNIKFIGGMTFVSGVGEHTRVEDWRLADAILI